MSLSRKPCKSGTLACKHILLNAGKGAELSSGMGPTERFGTAVCQAGKHEDLKLYSENSVYRSYQLVSQLSQLYI
jgi:hypothetical protein